MYGPGNAKWPRDQNLISTATYNMTFIEDRSNVIVSTQRIQKQFHIVASSCVDFQTFQSSEIDRYDLYL